MPVRKERSSLPSESFPEREGLRLPNRQDAAPGSLLAALRGDKEAPCGGTAWAAHNSQRYVGSW